MNIQQRNDLIDEINKIADDLEYLPRVFKHISKQWLDFQESIFNQFNTNIWDDVDDQTLIQSLEYAEQLYGKF